MFVPEINRRFGKNLRSMGDELSGVFGAPGKIGPGDGTRTFDSDRENEMSW